ncbi:hypothetical protein [Winogradskyella sp.]|uniref:hypothetical protein n=1 Tax=Winogradskyella sp. TaxID=1883156 RepID=UPI0025E8BAF4|nr:hypothetical protein [Winogradskyella sp.]
MPNAQRIEVILNEVITSKLQDFGLDNQSKKYIWQSQFNEFGIKQILQFTYRGITGSFWFGTNFKFIPFLTENKSLRHYSYKAHLFESKSYFDDENQISLWNERFFRKSLSNYIDKNLTKVLDFLYNLNTIESNITFAQKQINSEEFHYKLRDPNLKYVLAYLFDKQGSFNEAKKMKTSFLEDNKDYDDSVFRSLD